MATMGSIVYLATVQQILDMFTATAAIAEQFKTLTVRNVRCW